jgi:phage-related tail fiber protein
MTEKRIAFVDNGVLTAKDLNDLQDNIYSHVAERADKLTQDVTLLGARFNGHVHTGGDQAPQLDGTAIKPSAIATAHVAKGAITADKLAPGLAVPSLIARIWFDAAASRWNWQPAGRIRAVVNTREGQNTILTIALTQPYKAADYSVLLSATAGGANLLASVRTRTQTHLSVRMQTLDLSQIDIQFAIFGDVA